ncbi:MAG TPA: GNAT family N-acetyltransferase [Candidatus Corynebacterium avicola]|uniref:GNAT family N-acetyltransferase n=1 Tax=Candidatus Corynebacterium avicola TaxID=2838527 RepID=A0A9D1ULK2_9CORY|nr:GNAT family N-acetyltransferase [Candidatus Corynebacterium avicola]
MRTAILDDVEEIRSLERRAGAPFRDVGLDAIADDDPPDVGELSAAVGDGAVFVVDAPARLAAWLWLGRADGDLLIEQVSVDPANRGRRTGTRLVEYAVTLAREAGLPGVCLTTFSEVPWNAPLYRRLGFVELAPAELGDDLRRIRDAETAAGLDISPRIAMRRPVDGP